MKIDYATKVAGLEEKIEMWEKELISLASTPEDESITLFQIHSLLPNISANWEKLSYSSRLRFVGALVHRVVLSEVAPSWLKIEIYWKDALGGFVDVGHFRRLATNRSLWSTEEEAILRELYPHADASELLNALPDRSWKSIRQRAERIGRAR